MTTDKAHELVNTRRQRRRDKLCEQGTITHLQCAHSLCKEVAVIGTSTMNARIVQGGRPLNNKTPEGSPFGQSPPNLNRLQKTKIKDWNKKRKEKKNYAGSKALPASIGKGDTLAQNAVSLPHQNRLQTLLRTNSDASPSKPLPAAVHSSIIKHCVFETTPVLVCWLLFLFVDCCSCLLTAVLVCWLLFLLTAVFVDCCFCLLTAAATTATHHSWLHHVPSWFLEVLGSISFQRKSMQTLTGALKALKLASSTAQAWSTQKNKAQAEQWLFYVG